MSKLGCQHTGWKALAPALVLLALPSAALAQCTYDVSHKHVEFGAGLGEVLVQVSTQAGCTWTASTADPWLGVFESNTPISGGSSGTRIALRATASATSRWTTATVAGQTIQVTQNCVFSLNAASVDVPAGGAVVSIQVNTGAGCPWAAYSPADWMAPGGAVHTASDVVSFTVPANSGPPRAAYLRTGPKLTRINQAGTGSGDLTTGLAGHWRFDEGAGSTAGDSSGNGNNATIIGTPQWVAGLDGQALTVGDRVEVPGGFAAGFQSLSVSSWVRSPGLGRIAAFDTGSWDFFDFVMDYGSTSFSVRTNSGPEVVTFPIDTLALSWRHLAGTYDHTSRQLRVYVDGALGAVRTLPPQSHMEWSGYGTQLISWGVPQMTLDNSRIHGRALAEGDVYQAFAGLSSAVIADVTIPQGYLVLNVPTTGVVLLDRPAPAGGATVQLEKNSPVHISLAMPPSVLIPAGAESASFSVTASNSTGTVSILATYNGQVLRSFQVTPSTIAIQSLTLNPSTVTGGNNSTGTVTLNLPAPPGGAHVLLSTSAPLLLGIPGSVVVPAGGTSANFSITTAATTQTYSATITGTYNGTAQATLTVDPAGGGTLFFTHTVSFNPHPVVGGNSTTATVTFNQPAVAGQFVISPTGDPRYSVTSPVNVPAGVTTLNFPITTSSVASTQNIVLTTSYIVPPQHVSQLAFTTLTIVSATSGPRGWWKLDEGTGTAASDSSGNGNHGTLVGAPTWGAGASGQALSFSGANRVDVGGASSLRNLPAATVSAWVKPSGLNNHSPAFAFDSGSVDLYSLTLKDGGSPSLAGATFAVRTNQGALSVFKQRNPADWLTTQWYLLTGVFDPTAGVIKLFINGFLEASAPMPPNTVLDPGGFGIQRAYIGGDPNVAGFIGGIDDVRLWDRALSNAEIAALYTPPSQVSIQSLTLSPATVTGGNNSTGTVTLSGQAPAGGAVVTLSSNNASAPVPPSVTVAAGALTATFNVTTSVPGSMQTATITATYNGTAQGTLTVNPPAITVVSLQLTPGTVVGGNPSAGTVTISAAAPAGGFVVNLGSSNSAVATVPPQVTVGAGATTGNFTVTTLTQATQQAVTISANSGAATAQLTVNPPSGGGGGPVGWWKFDEGAGNTTADSSGNGNPGTLSGAPLPAWVPGRIGQALRFAGGYADAGSSSVLSANLTAVSASIWVKPDRTNNFSQAVVWESGSWDLYSIAIKDSGTAILQGVTFSVRTTQGLLQVTAPKADWDANTWYLITGTYDPATRLLRVYIGGTQAGELVGPAGAAMQNSGFGAQRLYLGGAPGAPFGGCLDDARIYGRALTAGEIAALASPPAGVSIQSVGLSPATVTGGANSTGTVTLTGQAPAGGAVVSLASNNGATQVPASVTVAAGATSATFNVTTSVVPAQQIAMITGSYNGTAQGTLTVNPAGGGAGLVGWWKLDEGSGSTAADSSPTGAAGALTGGPQWISGRNGQALSFNGTQNVNIGTSPVYSGVTSVTVSAWVKPSGTNDRRPVIVWDSGSWDLYSLDLKDSGSGALQGVYFSVRTGGGLQTVFLNRSGWNTGAWYRVTGSYDAATATLKVYIDSGAPVQSVLAPGTQLDSGSYGTRRLYLGGDPGAGLSGGVDDARIYNRALSDAEVAALAQ